MEEFKQYIVQNWPTIVEYAIMVVAYFLFFLYRSKVSGTRRDLTVMFKEKAQEVIQMKKVVESGRLHLKGRR